MPAQLLEASSPFPWFSASEAAQICRWNMKVKCDVSVFAPAASNLWGETAGERHGGTERHPGKTGLCWLYCSVLNVVKCEKRIFRQTAWIFLCTLEMSRGEISALPLVGGAHRKLWPHEYARLKMVLVSIRPAAGCLRIDLDVVFRFAEPSCSEQTKSRGGQTRKQRKTSG